MDSLQRVSAFWNWLPAFRVVAQTEHLPTASEELHVSTSALSRTIKLLEAEVGRPLFRRSGRRIELNEQGQELLAYVRSAMRLVHEGLLAATSDVFSGTVRISSSGLMTEAFVIPAVADVLAVHPALVPELQSVPIELAAATLLAGRLDVAFGSSPVHHEELTLVHLGTETSGIYCGPGHPLFEETDPVLERVLSFPFAAPPADPTGMTKEGWPADLPRIIGARMGQMRTGLQLCRSGVMLAVLPDVMAAHDGEVRRLPFDVVAPTQMFALHRRSLGQPGRTEAVVDAVSERIRSRSDE